VQPRESNATASKEGEAAPKTQDQVVDELCDILLAKLPTQIKKVESQVPQGKTVVEKQKKKDGIDIDSLRVIYIYIYNIYRFVYLRK
jgi:hypothetical protein